MLGMTRLTQQIATLQQISNCNKERPILGQRLGRRHQMLAAMLDGT
jgi:hypothetical protein